MTKIGTPRIVDDALRTTAPRARIGRPMAAQNQALNNGKTIFLPGATHNQARSRLQRFGRNGIKLHIRVTSINGKYGSLAWIDTDK